MAELSEIVKLGDRKEYYTIANITFPIVLNYTTYQQYLWCIKTGIFQVLDYATITVFNVIKDGMLAYLAIF